MHKNIIWNVAFSEVDITPDFQTELIGCYRPDSRSQGVLHRLSAQVLLFENNNDFYCLTAIDSLGLTVSLSNKLRSAIAEKLNSQLSHVMLNFSHTHSAPAPLSPLNGERYFCFLMEQIMTCVEAAKQKLCPFKLSWSVTDTQIGENRRDGCSVVDRRLGALKLEKLNGIPIAVVLRVTAHANILMSCNNQISGDYFVPAREKLGRYFKCPVMLIQGAAGNIKPAGTDKILGGNLGDLEKITDILLDSAKKLRFDPDEVRKIFMYSSEFDYYSDIPCETEAESIAAKAKKLFGIDGAQWLAECKNLRERGVSQQHKKGEVQFFYINEGCICGVADELFCEISIDVMKRTGSPFMFFNGYTNGCTGYLPHAEEWEKGGYETLYSYLQYYMFHGHVMPFRKDTAKRLITLVSDEWKKIF